MNTFARDLIIRHDPKAPGFPESPGAAIDRLLTGNNHIVTFRDLCTRPPQQQDPQPVVTLSPRQLGLLGSDSLGFPVQAPFAIAVGCSDARVPVEMLFGQGFNDIFDIRVAGNVLGPSEEGSLIYALTHFPPHQEPDSKLRFVVVLGHRGCGAVKAVVEFFQDKLDPSIPVEEGYDYLPGGPLGSIMRQIYRPAFVEMAKLFEHLGIDPRSKENKAILIDMTVPLHAHHMAQRAFHVLQQNPNQNQPLAIAHGVYNPTSFRVIKIPIVHLKQKKVSFDAPRASLGLITDEAKPGEFTQEILRSIQ